MLRGDGPTVAFWAKRRDDGALTPAVLAFIADMVPVAVARAAGKMGAGSSLDNSMRFHGGVADTEWVLIELLGELANGGFGHGSLRVWTAEGELIATGSQTASMRFLFDEGEMPNLPSLSQSRPGPAGVRRLERRRARPGAVPPRAGAPRGPRHDHLGGRPPRGAARHVRGTAARPPPGPGAADRREPARPRGVGVRRPAALAGRDERGGRPPAGDGAGRAVPLRPDASRAASTSTPGSPTWTSTACGRR